MYAPYQIRLDDGRMIFAPQDIDSVRYRSARSAECYTLIEVFVQVIRLQGSVTYTAEEMEAADQEEEQDEDYDEDYDEEA